jgi:hypothetical protein
MQEQHRWPALYRAVGNADIPDRPGRGLQKRPQPDPLEYLRRPPGDGRGAAVVTHVQQRILRAAVDYCGGNAGTRERVAQRHTGHAAADDENFRLHRASDLFYAVFSGICHAGTIASHGRRVQHKIGVDRQLRKN